MLDIMLVVVNVFIFLILFVHVIYYFIQRQKKAKRLQSMFKVRDIRRIY
jgi:preprotein translocase subunit YajC